MVNNGNGFLQREREREGGGKERNKILLNCPIQLTNFGDLAVDPAHSDPYLLSGSLSDPCSKIIL